jgi:hypothetical protein
MASILFVSNHGQPFLRNCMPSASPVEGGAPQPLGLGQVNHLAFGPGDGQRVIGRNTADPARWKRYRGGTAGPPVGRRSGQRRVPPHERTVRQPDLARCGWASRGLLSDGEGVGNLYSANSDGSDLQRHTDHDEHYARHAQTDGRRIVYQCGAQLWLFDPALGEARRIDVPCRRAHAVRRAASCRRPSICRASSAAPAGPQRRARRARQAVHVWRCGKARCASTGAADGRAPPAWPVAGRRAAPGQRRMPTTSGEERVEVRRRRRCGRCHRRRHRPRALAARRAARRTCSRWPTIATSCWWRHRSGQLKRARPQRCRPHRGAGLVARCGAGWPMQLLDQRSPPHRSSCRGGQRPTPPRHTARVPRLRAGLRPRRPLPLLPVDPHLRPGVRQRAVRAELPACGAALPDRAAGRMRRRLSSLLPQGHERQAMSSATRTLPPTGRLSSRSTSTGMERRVLPFPVSEGRFGQIAGVAGGKVAVDAAADRRRARPWRPQGRRPGTLELLRLRETAQVRTLARAGRPVRARRRRQRRCWCAKASGCAPSLPPAASGATTRSPSDNRRARAAGSTWTACA